MHPRQTTDVLAIAVHWRLFRAGLHATARWKASAYFAISESQRSPPSCPLDPPLPIAPPVPVAPPAPSPIGLMVDEQPAASHNITVGARSAAAKARVMDEEVRLHWVEIRMPQVKASAVPVGGRTFTRIARSPGAGAPR